MTHQKMSESNLWRPHPRSTVFGSVDYPPGGALGPRTQRDVQLVMQDRGSMRVWVNGEERAVPNGFVCLLWPGGLERFEWDARRRSHHRWIALHMDRAQLEHRRLAQARASSVWMRRETPAMRAVFDAGVQLGQGADANRCEARSALGVAYLSVFLEDDDAITSAKVHHPLPAAVTAALSLIADRYDRAISVEDLAASASVTPTHLSRLFRKHLRTTPMRALWDTRLERGRDLLRDTGLSVSEVAHRVGFASQYHFSRLFSQRFRKPPRAYRQRIWDDAE